MSNPYYTPSGTPPAQTRGVSANMRNEFDSVAAGFDDVYAEILALAAAIGVPTSVTEVPVASSATTDIGNNYGPVISITGTTNITSFGTNYKGAIFIRFAGALTLTHSSSLVLPGAADITTIAGDACIAIPIGNPASGWRIAAYCRMSQGLIDDIAVKTSTTYADPSWLTSLAWSKITGKPTTIAGYGITDAPTKTGTGASGTWGIDITGSAAQLGGMAAGAYIQKQVSTLATITGTGTAIVATQSPATSGVKVVDAIIVTGNSGAATTMAVNGDAAKSVKAYDSTGAKVNTTLVANQRCLFMDDGTDWILINPIPAASAIPKGHIYGLTGSSAGSTTLTVAAGEAVDSTGAALMSLASSMAKTNAAWSAGTGNGGLDTGSIAAGTWYHWYLIRNPSSGAVDLVFSTNASSPTLPSGYTQYRRIFTWRYTGGSIWEQISQNGNEFLWPTSVVDIDAQNPGTSAVTRTLTLPTGIVVDALISIGCYYGSIAFTALVSPLAINDQAPQASGTAALSGISNASSPTNTAGWNFFPARVRTNTSAQVRSRLSASGANDRLGIITFGWIDNRGQY